MADILINQLRDGSTTIPPGQAIPSSDRARLLTLGAVIWPASDPYVAPASRDALAALARGDVAAAQRLMIIGVIRSLRGSVVPGWNTVAQVFVDYAEGSNANDGLTAATPLADIEEYSRRLGDQTIDEAVTPIVRISVKGSKVAGFRLAPKMNGFVVMWLVGTRSPLAVPLEGTLTTFLPWNAATKTQCEFSFSGLPVSWTASGAVGRFLSLPSLGNVSIIVGKDLGSQTAVSCGPVDFDIFDTVPGSAVPFAAYTINAISGDRIEFSPQGTGILIVQDLELGNSSNPVVVTGTAPTSFAGCRFDTVNVYGPGLVAAVSCDVRVWQNYARDLHVANVVTSNFIVRAGGSSEVLYNLLSLGIISVDEHGFLRISSDASTNGASPGLLVKGRARVVSSFWARNASNNIILTEAGGLVVYTNAALVGSTGSVPAFPYSAALTISASLPVLNAAKFSGIVAA